MKKIIISLVCVVNSFIYLNGLGDINSSQSYNIVDADRIKTLINDNLSKSPNIISIKNKLQIVQQNQELVVYKKAEELEKEINIENIIKPTNAVFAQNITTTQSSSFPSLTTYTMTSAINTNSTSINTTTKLESDVKPISNSSIDMNIVYGILLLFIATICFISYMLINKRKKVQ